MNKFKVGDIIIGNELASKRYLYSKQNTVWKVVSVLDPYFILIAPIEYITYQEHVNPFDNFRVDPKCFDLYKKRKSHLPKWF